VKKFPSLLAIPPLSTETIKQKFDARAKGKITPKGKVREKRKR